MIEICGTVEQLTADTSWAPILIIPACSALAPTMKPVTLCRKMMGVFLSVSWDIVRDKDMDILLVACADKLRGLRGFIRV